MNILSKTILVGLIPLSINAIGLKEVLNLTIQNNLNIKSQDYNIASKNEEYKSVSNTFNPSLSIGSNYSKLDMDRRNTQIGSTTVAFAKLSVDLYNGGKNNSIKKQKEYDKNIANLTKQDIIKQTLLQAVTLYFNTKTIEANIKAFEDKSKVLKSEYQRKKQKYELNMITIDEVLKLQSEYEANNYQIEELKYQHIEALQNLSLLVGKNINHISNAKLPNALNLKYKQSYLIKSLATNLKVLDENIAQISSSKKVKIKLEDTLSTYSYSNYNTNLLKDLPKNQNQLVLSLSFNLYDTTTKAKKQAIFLAKKQKQKQLEYAKLKDKMIFNLSTKRLVTQKLKINSAKSALKMAQSVYKIIETKYKNGIIDNITYLDALSKKTINQALFDKALNDYEIAKANYYFASGVNYTSILHKL